MAFCFRSRPLGVAFVLSLVWQPATEAFAGDASRANAGAPPAGSVGEPDVARYCANILPAAAEARIAWQAKRLEEADAAVKQRLAELEKAEAAAREWVTKREALLKAASDDVAAIYAKMQPEAAATQISAMDDAAAAAILSKVKPQVASAILEEMEAARASKLMGVLAGLAPIEKKS